MIAPTSVSLAGLGDCISCVVRKLPKDCGLCLNSAFLSQVSFRTSHHHIRVFQHWRKIIKVHYSWDL